MNLRISGLIKFIGLANDMKTPHPEKSDDKLQVMIFTELNNLFQWLSKHKLSNALPESSPIPVIANKYIIFHVPPVYVPNMTCRAELVDWPSCTPLINFTGMKHLASTVISGTLENGSTTALSNLLDSPGELLHKLGFHHHDVSPK